MELYDETNEVFITAKACSIKLEHSLVSVSKWEARWEKPFLTSNEKSVIETLDYIKCMTITQNVPNDVYSRLTEQHIESINQYIDAPMTATKINHITKGKPNRDIITSEVIYYYMVALTIPFECQKWHLTRLLTLIHVCNIKNQPEKKMGKQELISRNRDLNEQRRKQLNTKG